jgi:hypothetical protein
MVRGLKQYVVVLDSVGHKEYFPIKLEERVRNSPSGHRSGLFCWACGRSPYLQSTSTVNR